MANIKSFPNNQDDFIGAEEVMKWLHGRTSGVFAAGGQCAVAAVADSMSVTVSDGNGWMANSEGDGIVWWISNEKDTGTKLTITGDMADATLPRIDRIVVSWPTTNYVGLPTVEFKKGTPASTPVPPALTNNNIMRQISLAQIRIPAGATAITASMITDERLDPAVCGIVTESIKLDTSVINAQLLDAYREYTRNMDKYTADSRAAFEAWFEAVKDALSGDVAGNLQNQINELREEAKTYTDTKISDMGLVTATHAKTGTAHALTAPAGCGNLKFTAVAPFEDGDTITLNGAPVTAKTQDGEALTGGAWAAGAVVMCLVSPDGGTLFFRGGGSNKGQIIVTTTKGADVTATMKNEVKHAVEENGIWILEECKFGTWTVTATLGNASESIDVEINNMSRTVRCHIDVQSDVALFDYSKQSYGWQIRALRSYESSDAVAPHKITNTDGSVLLEQVVNSKSDTDEAAGVYELVEDFDFTEFSTIEVNIKNFESSSNMGAQLMIMPRNAEVFQDDWIAHVGITEDETTTLDVSSINGKYNLAFGLSGNYWDGKESGSISFSLNTVTAIR